ncbi:hypothetical protein [Sinomonas terrae]|uniref:Uncharacterized protein n=1 Tax=Sinomonas terrae TaxID=2908838 RepID=A0ABS9TYQ2_9MICC|nr:hypothetical protein [Sinomonas terrae]MCH6469554.1 hypothetical protein [Sinomonas terrae]
MSPNVPQPIKVLALGTGAVGVFRRRQPVAAASEPNYDAFRDQVWDRSVIES